LITSPLKISQKLALTWWSSETRRIMNNQMRKLHLGFRPVRTRMRSIIQQRSGT